jgi:hypothetical protein
MLEQISQKKLPFDIFSRAYPRRKTISPGLLLNFKFLAKFHRFSIIFNINFRENILNNKNFF